MSRNNRALSRALIDGGGVTTVAEARRLGLHRNVLARASKSGRIERVGRATYARPGAMADPLARIRAGVASAPAGAVASHGSAAWLHGMRRVAVTHPVHVTVPRGGGVRSVGGVRRHATRQLEAVDVIVVQGVAATSVARTLIDLAGHLPPLALLAVLDDALCGNERHRPHVHARARALTRGRAGVGALVRATAPDAEIRFWSWLERRMGGLLSGAGVQGAEWNRPVSDAHGTIGVVDIAWPAARLVVELHGLAFHQAPGQRARDAAKRNRLVAAGWRVLEFTYEDVVGRPQQVIAAITGALA